MPVGIYDHVVRPVKQRHHRAYQNPIDSDFVHKKNRKCQIDKGFKNGAPLGFFEMPGKMNRYARSLSSV
jgi:hypothetical protein